MDKDSRLPGYLFVLPWSPAHVGGVNRVVVNLALEMQASGSFDPIILICSWDDIAPRFGEYNGLRTVQWRIRSYGENLGIKGRIVYWLWERRFQPLFKHFCKNNAITTINAHYVNDTAFTFGRALSDDKNKIQLLLSLHGADLSEIGSESDILKQTWRSLFRRADGLVVCSDDLGKRVVATFGSDVSPITIHNGVDISGLTDAVDSHQLVDEKVILNIAKFERKKGQDVLIEAFSSISKDYDNLTLVLVGANDSALRPLKQLCSDHGIEDRVHFHLDIPHERIAEYFARATVFVLPSRQEPFGIVLLEAGSFALPVIASKTGGIPEIITNGLTGRLVKPNDPVELASCLRSILDNPSNSKAMGERLRSHVLNTFSWKKTHDKYVALTYQNPC